MDNNQTNQQSANPKQTSLFLWVVLAAVVLAVGGMVWWQISKNTNENQKNNINTLDWKTFETSYGGYMQYSFQYPPYLSPRKNYPSDLISEGPRSWIESAQSGFISDNFLQENGGELEYLQGVSLEFGGYFREISVGEVTYGKNNALERRIEYSDTLDGPMTKIALVILMPTYDPGFFLLFEIRGKNTTEFNQDVSRLIETVQ